VPWWRDLVGKKEIKMTQAAARLRAERINMHVIATYAARRAMVGVDGGERSPAGAARPAVELVRITEALPAQTIGGKPRVVEVTRSGFKTARKRLPAVLARLDERDAKRVAASRYAYAAEKVGSVAGASAEGGKTDGGAPSNDGGVTTRILHAATLRAVERVLADVGVALVPSARGGGHRKAITARALMDAVCIGSLDMKAILVVAGWSGQRRDVAKLNAAADVCLERMACALGLARPAALTAARRV
jgi:hypothetical protein